MPINFERLKTRTGRLILALILTTQCVAGAGVFLLVRRSRQAHELMLLNRDNLGVLIPSDDEAIICPNTVRPGEAKLRPDRPVVGVEIGGKARAYALDGLGGPSGHVVNDMIGRIPVSVTFCGVTNCVRVYTDSARSAALDVQVAGLYRGEMAMKIAGALYLQESARPLKPETNAPPIPYRTLNPIVTSWGSWLKSHPNTDVYARDSRLSRPGVMQKPIRGTS
jgi:hypothetical protein